MVNKHDVYQGANIQIGTRTDGDCASKWRVQGLRRVGQNESRHKWRVVVKLVFLCDGIINVDLLGWVPGGRNWGKLHWNTISTWMRLINTRIRALRWEFVMDNLLHKFWINIPFSARWRKQTRVLPHEYGQPQTPATRRYWGGGRNFDTGFRSKFSQRQKQFYGGYVLHACDSSNG